MIEISPKIVKRLSRIGARAAYGQALMYLMEDNALVYALSADLGSSSGLQRVMNPEEYHFLNVGIAEQNLIGVSSGLAKEGFIPFASSFAPFITLRCGDQIRMNMGYMKQNVKAVGLGSGFALGELGNSHYGLEDMAMMRSIPGMTVINPADGMEILKTVYAAAEYQGPVYIRLTGGTPLPVIYEEDYDFAIGKGIVLKKGNDVAMIATGSMVHKSLEAADILGECGIACSVVDMHTVKPLDESLIKELCKTHSMIVTVEEHSMIGGLGSAVAEYRTQADIQIKQVILGSKDAYGPTGSYDYQLERNGLTAEHIADRVKTERKNKS